jgi:hypothetical protein
VALNPAMLPAGLEHAEYMDICLAMIRSADTIYLLHGWEQSEGAQAETTTPRRSASNSNTKGPLDE